MKESFYRGQLEQIHGKADAASFIQMGKFKEVVDSQGTVKYEKVSDKEIIEKSRAQTIGITRHSILI